VHRVLVTRARSDAAPLSNALRQAGFEPVEVPLLQREPIHGAVSDPTLGTFDLLLVTSAAVVDTIRVSLADGWTPPERVAAVGPQSAKAAINAGLSVSVVPRKSTGTALVDALGDVKGLSILYPQSEIASPTTAESLREKGAKVVEVIAYRNAVPQNTADSLRAIWPVDLITLMSGSAARRLQDAITEAQLSQCGLIVAIGPSTAKVAEEAGLPVHAVAVPHNVSGVVDAVRMLAKRLPNDSASSGLP
jgi:uroporphyrinogen-III synthase